AAGIAVRALADEELRIRDRGAMPADAPRVNEQVDVRCPAAADDRPEQEHRIILVNEVAKRHKNTISKSFHTFNLQYEYNRPAHLYLNGVGNVGVYRLHSRRHRADELFTAVCGTLNDRQNLLNLLIVHPNEDGGVALAQEPSGTGQHRRIEPVLGEGIDQPSHVLLPPNREGVAGSRPVLATVQGKDGGAPLDALTEDGINATMRASTGGFRRGGKCSMLI